MTRRDRFLLDFDAPSFRAIFRALWAMRKALKWIAIPLRFNDRLIECCSTCGVQQPVVWHAPHELWETVTGFKRFAGGEWAPGIYCPRCFDQMAEAKGILLCWVPLRHGDDAALLDSARAARSPSDTEQK